MPKSRLNKKHVKRLRQKQSFVMATNIRLMAEQLPNQAALRSCLMQQPDTAKRLAVYNFMKPFLKFHSEFPSTIETPGIILTDR